MYLDEPKKYEIASAVISGILFIASIFLTIFTFIFCRTTGDPARRPFTWLKVALVFAILALACQVVANACNVAIIDNEIRRYTGFDVNNPIHIMETEDRIGSIGVLFQAVMTAFILLCFVDLGLSFLYIWKRSRAGHAIAMVIAGMLALALVAEQIGAFAEYQRVYTDAYELWDSSDEELGVTEKKTYEYGRKLLVAYYIAVFVLSVAAAAFAAFIFVTSRSKATLQKNAGFFLASGIVFLIPTAYSLAYDVKYMLPERVDEHIYSDLLFPILYFLPTFVTLYLLYHIGSAKIDGIYTDADVCVQQWMPVQQGPSDQEQGFPTTRYDPGVQYASQ